VLSAVQPQWRQWLGISEETDWAHLPAHVLAIGAIVFVIGLLIAARRMPFSFGKKDLRTEDLAAG
jgi:hypothetical protein